LIASPQRVAREIHGVMRAADAWWSKMGGRHIRAIVALIPERFPGDMTG